MRSKLPSDVLNLVIASRIVAYEDQGPDACKALDQACEAFSDSVPWGEQPSCDECDEAIVSDIGCDQTLQALRLENVKLKAACKKSGLCMTCLLNPPDVFGCSDCLNTGWDGGCPPNSPEEIQTLFSGMINDFSEMKKRVQKPD